MYPLWPLAKSQIIWTGGLSLCLCCSHNLQVMNFTTLAEYWNRLFIDLLNIMQQHLKCQFYYQWWQWLTLPVIYNYWPVSILTVLSFLFFVLLNCTFNFNVEYIQCMIHNSIGVKDLCIYFINLIHHYVAITLNGQEVLSTTPDH